MEKEILRLNAMSLEREFQWLGELVTTRLQLYFNQPSQYSSIYDIPAPDLEQDQSIYARELRGFSMNIQERIVLLLALAPHVKPQVLDPLFMKNALYERGYSEFGGIMGQQHSGFIPTGETALFLLAADDVSEKLALLKLFEEDHFFFRFNILRLEAPASREPFLSGVLAVSQEYLSYFTDSTGTHRPKYSAQFPAKRISTNLLWEDLILDNQAKDEIEEIMVWLEHHKTILLEWRLERVLKPGYRALFYGPPGTGKTMASALLGKRTGREVYRIDLSQVVSKYIGETEKNLSSIFDQAENRNWILFFDEADSLFGKRTSTKDAKDRYANQEVAYLLQRIEDFPGVAILATNFKGNIDEAFVRRFQSIIYFQMPNAEQRLRLWRSAFSGNFQVSEEVDWEHIAQQYELSGGGIFNVLQFCALAAVLRNPPLITQQDIIKGIRKELRKEGKTES
jgi:AAA+ superfamily predicted ATPase